MSVLESKPENMEKVNTILKNLGKRNMAVKLLKGEYSFVSHEFYKLTSGKHLVVTWEHDSIKSILEQQRKNERYTYMINGQSGTNTKEIYWRKEQY